MDVSHEWNNYLLQIIESVKDKPDSKILYKHRNLSQPDSILEYMNKNRSEMISQIGLSKFDSIVYYAKKFDQFVSVYSSFFNNTQRDSIMAENVLEFSNKYLLKNEKTVVYGHLSHLNKKMVNNSIVKSTGFYLNKYFGKNYCAIALLVSTGNNQAYQIDHKKLNIKPLSSPPYDSLEQFCNTLSNCSFYLNITKVPVFNKIMYYRFVGGIPKEVQFFPGNPSLRMDGI